MYLFPINPGWQSDILAVLKKAGKTYIEVEMPCRHMAIFHSDTKDQIWNRKNLEGEMQAVLNWDLATLVV